MTHITANSSLFWSIITKPGTSCSSSVLNVLFTIGSAILWMSRTVYGPTVWAAVCFKSLRDESPGTSGRNGLYGCILTTQRWDAHFEKDGAALCAVRFKSLRDEAPGASRMRFLVSHAVMALSKFWNGWPFDWLLVSSYVSKLHPRSTWNRVTKRWMTTFLTHGIPQRVVCF